MLYTAKDRTPYTYVIKNILNGKRYYGCRYAKGCHPSEFWKSYFTSSKIIKKLIKEVGTEIWEFEIREIFVDIISCKSWEERVLKKLGIPKNQNWYNQSIGGKTFLLQGEELENQKKAVSDKMRWLHQQPEYIARRKEIMIERWSTQESRDHHSQKIKDYWNNSEWVDKIISQRIENNKNPIIRQNKREAMLEVWKRPEYIERHKSAMEVVRSSPTWLENNKLKQTEAWQDPIKRENRLKNRKPHTNERKANQSQLTTEQNKKNWQDPEVRAKRIEGINKSIAKRKAAKAALMDQDLISN